MKSSEIRFGGYRFDPESGALTDPHGTGIELRHQSREVLRRLARTPGKTVSKREFFATVWKGNHVGEDGLVQCIHDIRAVLGEDAKQIVETVPRRGYRLNADAPRSNRSRIVALIAMAIVGVLAVVAGGAYLVRTNAAPNGRPVIAVLPFDDFSMAEHRGQLSDAISEGIITNLARSPELTVVARTSSFQFREAPTDIRQIGEALGADFVLEGSLQYDGEALRVTAQLIDASQNAHVWVDEIDAEIDAFFRLSDEISRRVARSVVTEISEIRTSRHGAEGVDALLLSLEARQLLLSGLSKRNVARAVELAREAMHRYPDEPWGHISLAVALRTQVRFGWPEDPVTTLAEAREAARRAVELAPDHYGAHFALGRVLMQEGEIARAIRALETARRMNPADSETLNALAQAYFYVGRNDEALAALADSARIDPLNTFIHPWMSAWVLWQTGDCNAAQEAFNRIAEPPAEARKLEAAIRACRGETEDARRALAEFRAGAPDWTVQEERAIHASTWSAEGALDRWLADLTTAGLPEG